MACNNKNILSLIEDTRDELLTKADKNRQQRSKNYSVGSDSKFEIKKGNLIITTYVGDYEQKIELSSFLDRLRQRVLSSSHYKINVDNVRTLLRDCFSDLDLKISCGCADWKYRLAYKASKEGYIFGPRETRPPKITNPAGSAGSLCKHLNRALSNYSWLSFFSGAVYKFLFKHQDEIGDAFGIPNLSDYFARSYNKRRRPERETGDEE